MFWSRRIVLLSVLVVVAACQSTPPERVPLTAVMRQRYQLSADELRTLQYYISDRIVLERVAIGGHHTIERGKLIDRHGTLVERVVIEFATPGIVEPSSRVGGSGSADAIEVSFVRGAPLRFSARRADGSYSLSGEESGGLLTDLFAGWGVRRTLRVEFGGAEWKAVAGEGAKLLIERRALGELVRKKRVLPGVRLPESSQ